MATDVMHFRDVRISDAIRNDPNLYRLVEQATEFCRTEVATESASIVTLEWSRTTDPSGRTMLELRLEDDCGAVSRSFSVEELSHLEDGSIRWELQHLWSELLQIRSHHYLKRLRQIVDELEDE